MRYLVLLFCLLAFSSLSAQTPDSAAKTPPQRKVATPSAAPAKVIAAQPSVEDKTLTLQERYLIMKSKSQSYNDYKVIKETVLDGVWKIIRDSMNTKKAALAGANKTIAELKGEVSTSKETLQQKESSMQDIEYDSTHITVLGIGMSKSFFVGLVGVVVLVLVLGVLLVSGRLKMMQSTVREKSELALAIHSEYEEYKRKALDKQTKLSRELQNERNKLAEMRR